MGEVSRGEGKQNLYLHLESHTGTFEGTQTRCFKLRERDKVAVDRSV